MENENVVAPSATPEQIVVDQQMLNDNPILAEAGVEVGTVGIAVDAPETPVAETAPEAPVETPTETPAQSE